MALIEKVWTDRVAHPPSLHLDPVEVAQMSKPSSLWFGEVPENAYENEQRLRSQICQGCTLYSGSEGNFDNRNLKQIIAEDLNCTGIYLEIDDSIPFRKVWRLQAAAPRETFSRPDPRANCATHKARP